ncbi:MAG: hypothetical protein A3E83_01125 [Gammaproteobacteria bacterium RIFCSPHIGHO2_12_FULL_41_20]|nr:MAG: hypothetical protein A3E83_01125 [Gammaproteobacteria bacterium RIFCSPHIGHO2_12_FULL_41_20]
MPVADHETSDVSADILAKLTPLFPVLGITRVANVTGLDRIGIPVAMCIRPNAKHLSVSQGKGLTWEQAKITAIMESVEAYHAENPALPALVGTYQQLQSHYHLLNPAILSGGFFQWQADKHVLEWLAATDLFSQRTLYIPREIVCLDSSYCRLYGALFAVSSTGLAAGSTHAAAILHGLYEVIERDALWHWRSLSRAARDATSVALDNVDSVVNRELLKQLFAAELRVSVWNMTSTLEVPAYYCELADESVGVCHGSAAHASAEVALTKALLEAAQARLTYICGTREEIFPGYYTLHHRIKSYTRGAEDTSPVSTAIYSTLSMHKAQNKRDSMAVMLESPKSTRACEVRGVVTQADDMLQWLMQRLVAHQFTQLIVLDHTKPELAIPVVHVIVPGMQQ